MRPTVQEDPHRLRPGEHGQPLDHGAGQEMGFVRLQDDITASGHALARSTGTPERPECVPTLERGNDQDYDYFNCEFNGLAKHYVDSSRAAG